MPSSGVIKVVHLINALPGIGGAERLVLDLAISMPDVETSVITWLSPDVSLIGNGAAPAVEIIPLRPLTRRAWLDAWRAARRADLFHVHLFPSQYLGTLLRGPKIFTEHNTWNRRRDRPVFRSLDRWSYSAYQAVVAVSDETGAALTHWLGTLPTELRVIRNGIDTTRFDATPRDLAACSTAPKTVGMAARFSVEKDQATIVAALALLPPNFRLRLAGSGPMEHELRARVTAAGLDGRVDFLGVVTDMPKFYRQLDVYVQSSRHDGFSLVAVEAMASGLPVLASDIDGLRSTIGNNANLFLPGDSGRLAHLLTRLFANSETYASASEYSVERSRQFSIATTAAQYRNLYADLISKRNRARAG